jgi:hypothetical protein
LRAHGESPHAFTFKKPFPAPDTVIVQPAPVFEDCLA